MVFKGRGHDVLLALQGAVLGGRPDGLVVCLTAPGGEVNFTRFGVETFGYVGSGLGQGLCGSLADGVQGRGISKVLLQIGEHGLYGNTTHFGGCCVVDIYHKETSFELFLVIY